MKKLLSLLLAAELGTAFAAGELFSNGKSDWQIVIPEHAGTTVQYASEELQRALKKVSGTELPIIKNKSPGISNRIVIGDLSSNLIKEKASALKLAFSPIEEIAVHTLDGNLYLAGNTPRAALYAVYTFLQDQLDIRWLRPGPEGEYMPQLKSYTLPELSVNKKPSFRYRGLHLCYRHIDPEFETWMARNFINIMRSDAGQRKTHQQRKMKGYHIMISNHNAHLPASLFKTDPECFAELNGKRHNRQICMTNPKTKKLVAEQMKKWVRNNPELEILSVFPADNMDYCMCKGCTAQDRSTTWFNFFRKICLDVREEFPKLKFSTIAYQGYLKAPKTDLSFAEIIEYCNHNRCYTHQLDSACPLNQRDLKDFAEWSTLKVPMGIYGYEFDIFAAENTVSIPFYNVIREGIRKFHSLGVQSVITEYWLGFPAKNPQERRLSVQNALGIWLYTRLLWNVNDDMDKLIAEWNSKMYGGAAREAAEITRILSENWDQLKGHISNYHNAPFGTAAAMFTPERFTKLKKLLKNGFEKKLSPQERTNFELLQSFVLQWEQAYFEGTQSNRQINIPKTPNAPYALPAFQTNNQGKAPRTDAFFSWDDKYLNITVHCYDSDMEKLRAEALKRDEQVWMDDCIEIFLSNPANTEGIYKHIAVNPRGTLYDAAAYGPGGADIHWNPEIKVKTELLPDHWKVDLKIPFASNPPVPKAGNVWRFNINRSIGNGRKGMANSGYPEASYHNPNGFAALSFSEKARVEKQVLFLVPEKFMKNTKNIGNALFRDGWNFQFCSCQKELPQNLDSYRILVVRLPQFGLQGKVDFKKLAREFLNQGKTVIFSSYEWLPLENYLGDPKLKLQGSGWKINKLRRNLDISTGKWGTTPENLQQPIKELLSPSYGYNPQTPEGWKSLISLEREDGKKFSTMLVRKQFNGLLIVTGGEMGLGGGHVLFGNTVNTVTMLLNNLLANRKELME